MMTVIEFVEFRDFCGQKSRNSMTAIALLILLAAPSAAQPQFTFTSGPARASLIELDASADCPSCPSPKEKPLSALVRNRSLWKDFVPVLWLSRKTRPGFRLNGTEWKEWRAGRIPRPSGVAGQLIVQES